MIRAAATSYDHGRDAAHATTGFEAYRASIYFTVQGAPFEMADDLSRLEEDADATQLACEAEVIKVLEPFHTHLERLGCISRCIPRNEFGPECYLIVASGWSPPHWPLPWDETGPPEMMLGLQSGHQLCACPEATLHAYIRLEKVALFDAFNRLQTALNDELSYGCGRTPERLPKDGEDQEAWSRRIGVSRERLAEVSDRLTRVGFELDLYNLFLDQQEGAEEADYLVDKIIPFSALTLVVGSGMAGKSSMVHELLSAVTAKSGPKSFLGQRVSGRHVGVLISGEETRRAIQIRRERHSKVWGGADVLFVEAAGPSDLIEALARLERLPDNSVIVVDPATLYIDGDDTKTHIVNEFYKPLLAFAKRKKAAIVVVHHLVKDPPKTISRILPSVRGAAVHTERVRMTIALIDRGNGTVGLGTIKHNLPEGAWAPINKELPFRRESDTFRLLPIEAELPVLAEPENEFLDRVCDTVARLNREGVTVHRTGVSGLYKLNAPELRACTRSEIQSGILTLLEAGKLKATSKGLVAVSNGLDK